MGSKTVAIIGSGLAGITAAAFARRAGLKAVVVSGGKGSTSLGSGALDIAGDQLKHTLTKDMAHADLKTNIKELLRQNPGHPYGLIDKNKQPLSVIKDAVELLFSEGDDLPLEGDLQKNRSCFTSLGTVKFTALHPKNIAGPSIPGIGKPLVLSLSGLTEFDAEMWAKIAADNMGRLGYDFEPQTGQVLFMNDRERTSPVFKSEIEKNRDEFIDAICSCANENKDYSSVVIPPVLPGNSRSEIFWLIGEKLNVPIYGLLSLPPSVPGMEISRHISARAKELGVEFVKGRANDFETDGKKVTSLFVVRNEIKTKVDADAFILASGMYIGGGINKTGDFCESVFGLPVYLGEKPARNIYIEKMLGRHVNEQHELFEAGVKTDKMLRPLGTENSPAFENLFAAGSVLSGYNYLTDGTGSGTAMYTGAMASIKATDYL
jgi:glycerol-3-phosphate dehydrogenase subunit B